MRIACIHVPQFALQCVIRIDPTLRGAAVAVVGSGLDGPAATSRGTGSLAIGSPIVHACSRAAWALGVRIGMTATAARATSPDLALVSADLQLERETVRALADALLGASAVVDLGGRVGAAGAHLAMYCEVPSKTRGTSFGERLLDRLELLGVTGRIGIADDRFTAWVAASQGGVDESGVVSVPRGGSAAFLAPRPLSLLAITPEVQHMLEALGVRTLGEFAALPAPSVARPFEADYQALARGESGNTLRPYAPEAPIREHLSIGRFELTSEASAPVLSAPIAIAMLAERIALRLAGRARGAARLEVTIDRAPAGAPDRAPAGSRAAEGGERVIPISALATAGRVLDSAASLADVITGALGDDLATAWRIRVAVVGEALAGDEVPAAAAAGGATAAIATQAPIEALNIVLSSTGGSWHLTSPVLRAERRDPHRRTQRGKQRRRTRTEPVLATSSQARLFKNLP